jgi:hypothetical protein
MFNVKRRQRKLARGRMLVQEARLDLVATRVTKFVRTRQPLL